MKYKLIIDKKVEEEIIAIVHAPSSLTQQIENLVCSFTNLLWPMNIAFCDLMLRSAAV